MSAGPSVRVSAPDPVAAAAAITALAASAEAADGIAPFSDEALLALKAERRHAIVAEQDDGLRGASIFGEGELELCVDPRSRGEGVGTALMTEALDRLGHGAASDDEVLAWAHGAHPAAGALARRFGF